MAGNLNKYEVAQFKEAFALFDANKDGTIDPDELKSMMAKLGQECTDIEIKDLIEVVDELGTGRIDFPSFLKQYQHKDDEDENEFLNEAFNLIGGGQPLDASAMQQFLASVGQNIIDDEAIQMVKLKDADGDGKIGLEDFKKMWNQKEAEKIVNS